MAEIKIIIPDSKLQRVIDDICGALNYTGDKGETKAQYAKRMIIKYVKDTMKNYESQQAANVVIDTAMIDVENNINIT